MNFLKNLFPKSRGCAATLPPPDPARPAPAASIPASAPAPAAPLDSVAIPLKSITDTLPPELKEKLRREPSAHVQVSIPRDLILPQLKAGAVRIPFGRLRTLTPDLFFQPDTAHDEEPVVLPLAIVVRECMPARRQDQRLPAILVNVPSVFARGSSGDAPRLNGGPAIAAAKPEAWYSERRPSLDQPAPPVAAEAAAKPLQEIETPKPAPPPRRRRDTAPPEDAAGAVLVPLSAVLDSFPDAIRDALGDAVSAGALLRIPRTALEPGLRKGRLEFTWEQVRGWAGANLPLPPGSEVAVLLPMATTVPLFLAGLKNPAEGRKRVEIDEHIPSVFKTAPPSREPLAAPPPPPARAAAPAPPSPDFSPPAPVAPPAPFAPAPETAPAGRPASTASRALDHVASFPGVKGTFLATTDGLIVAARLPDGNENVLAAFAPTVFAQLTKYAEMARLGVPLSITVQLGEHCFQVHKAGKVYLGILAAPDRPLTLQELREISASLNAL